MCDESEHDIALHLWTVSFQYFQLVQNVAREITSQGNQSVIVRDGAEGLIEPAEFHEKTKWSDHSLGIPLLFNLYHGIELLVKGFLLITPGVNVKSEHNIQKLCRQFAKSYEQESELIVFLRKYTEEKELPRVIQEFLKDNDLAFDKLYQTLRYPVGPKFKNSNNYMMLMNRHTDGVPFFNDLVSDIERARRAAVMLGSSLRPNL